MPTPSPIKRPLIAIVVAVSLITFTPRSAHADFEEAMQGLLVALLLLLTEPAFPDVRLEFGGDREEVGFDLSWPIPAHLAHINLGEDWFTSLSLVAEPHFQATDEVFRGVFLAQVLLLVGDNSDRDFPTGAGFRFEGGGVVGEDGDGWMAGTGVMFGNGIIGFGAVYRYTDTDGLDRHDIALDLQFALPLSLIWSER